jgi:hypothetical protein
MMDGADDGYKGTRSIWPTIIFGVCFVALVVVAAFAVSVLR